MDARLEEQQPLHVERAMVMEKLAPPGEDELRQSEGTAEVKASTPAATETATVKT